MRLLRAGPRSARPLNSGVGPKVISRVRKLSSVLAAALVVLSAVAAEPRTDPVSVLDGVTGIDWSVGPSDFVGRKRGDATVVWLGRILEMLPYANARGETVLDFYCAYIPLTNPSPDGLATPILVKLETDQLFLVSIRSPKLPLEQARKLSREVREKVHYALIAGQTIQLRSYHGRPVVLVGAYKAIFSDKLSLKSDR